MEIFLPVEESVSKERTDTPLLLVFIYLIVFDIFEWTMIIELMIDKQQNNSNKSNVKP